MNLEAGEEPKQDVSPPPGLSEQMQQNSGAVESSQTGR